MTAEELAAIRQCIDNGMGLTHERARTLWCALEEAREKREVLAAEWGLLKIELHHCQKALEEARELAGEIVVTWVAEDAGLALAHPINEVAWDYVQKYPWMKSTQAVKESNDG